MAQWLQAEVLLYGDMCMCAAQSVTVWDEGDSRADPVAEADQQGA